MIDIAKVEENIEVSTTAKAAAETSEPRKAKIDKQGRAYGTGRRKESAARVWIKPGKGKVTVNGSKFESYFKRPVLRMIVNQPFQAVDSENKFDVFVTVKGGGLSGQAGAVRHGISRALDNFNPESNHTILSQGGYLTRDSRAVERKKYGQAKARKSFQFSKR